MESRTRSANRSGKDDASRTVCPLAICALALLVVAPPSVQAAGDLKSRATTRSVPIEEKENPPQASETQKARPVSPKKTRAGSAAKRSRPQMDPMKPDVQADPGRSVEKRPLLDAKGDAKVLQKVAPGRQLRSGSLVGPGPACPCRADLDSHGWDGGSIPYGGCVSDAGNGFPQYGLARQVFGGPDVTTFTIIAKDVEPDGNRDYTCRILYSEDGIGGSSPSFSSTKPVPQAGLVACANRMQNNPQVVLDCILP